MEDHSCKNLKNILVRKSRNGALPLKKKRKKTCLTIFITVIYFHLLLKYVSICNPIFCVTSKGRGPSCPSLGFNICSILPLSSSTSSFQVLFLLFINSKLQSFYLFHKDLVFGNWILIWGLFFEFEIPCFWGLCWFCLYEFWSGFWFLFGIVTVKTLKRVCYDISFKLNYGM